MLASPAAALCRSRHTPAGRASAHGHLSFTGYPALGVSPRLAWPAQSHKSRYLVAATEHRIVQRLDPGFVPGTIERRRVRLYPRLCGALRRVPGRHRLPTHPGIEGGDLARRKDASPAWCGAKPRPLPCGPTRAPSDSAPRPRSACGQNFGRDRRSISPRREHGPPARRRRGSSARHGARSGTDSCAPGARPAAASPRGRTRRPARGVVPVQPAARPSRRGRCAASRSSTASARRR